MKFINRATLALEDLFAPRGQEHGSMVDILGVGVIVKGESGIGKSECVLALVERGYSLVADDVTKLKLIDGRVVIGTSAGVTRDHMEVRGIGIIDVGAMFGVKSISSRKQLDLIVTCANGAMWMRWIAWEWRMKPPRFWVCGFRTSPFRFVRGVILRVWWRWLPFKINSSDRA